MGGEEEEEYDDDNEDDEELQRWTSVGDCLVAMHLIPFTRY